MKFNYIVGNPPYQYPKGTFNDGKKLWKDISNKVIPLFSEEMFFITPHSASHFLKSIPETVLLDYTTDKYFDVGVKIISWKIKKQDLNTRNLIPCIISRDGTMDYNKDLYDNQDRIGRNLYKKRYAPCVYKKLFLLTKVTSPGTFTVWNNYLKKEKIKVTKPEYYQKKKLVYSVSTAHKLSNFMVTSEDFGSIFIQINVSKMTSLQIQNIKDFLMNPLIKLFCDKFKSLNGTGFNRGMYCLPMINFNKNYNREDIIELMKFTKEELEWLNK